MYSVEISYDRYDTLSLEAVFADWDSAELYASVRAEILGGDYRVIIVKQWFGEEYVEIGKFDGYNN